MVVKNNLNTYLLFLLVEIINDDSNEKIQSEECTKYDEDDKINIHVQVLLIGGLFFHL